MLAAATLALGLTSSGVADAEVSYDSAYRYKQVFGSALRLVKVDMGMTVSETNAEWGYFLFVYQSRESGKRKNRGAFTFVEQDDGSVRVSLQMPQMPGYHEQLIVDKLKLKLHADHGAPPKRVKRATRDNDDKRERDDTDDEPPQQKGKRGDDAPRDGHKKTDRRKRRPRWQRPARGR